jgi:hypothetical protein
LGIVEKIQRIPGCKVKAVRERQMRKEKGKKTDLMKKSSWT